MASLFEKLGRYLSPGVADLKDKYGMNKPEEPVEEEIASSGPSIFDRPDINHLIEEYKQKQTAAAGGPKPGQSMTDFFLSRPTVDEEIQKMYTPARAALAGAEAGTPNPDELSASLKLKESQTIPGGGGYNKPIPKMGDVDFGTGSINNMENMRAAQDASNSIQTSNEFLRGADRLGAAIAGVKPGSDDIYAERIKGAGQPVEQFKQLADQEKNDPNSPISKGFREYIKRFGVNLKGDVSAAAASSLLPTVFREFEMEEQRQLQKQLAHERSLDRKLQLELAAGVKEKAAKTKAEEAREGAIADARKESISGERGKLYGNYRVAEKAMQNIESFIKNPTGYSDYSSLLSGLKALQGDNSVVRAEEIRLGMKAGSLKDKALNAIDSIISGKTLQPGQRDAIAAAVKALKENSKAQFIESNTGIRNQSTRRGLPLNEIYDADLIPQNSKDLFDSLPDKK